MVKSVIQKMQQNHLSKVKKAINQTQFLYHNYQTRELVANVNVIKKEERQFISE